MATPSGCNRRGEEEQQSLWMRGIGCSVVEGLRVDDGAAVAVGDPGPNV